MSNKNELSGIFVGFLSQIALSELFFFFLAFAYTLWFLGLCFTFYGCVSVCLFFLCFSFPFSFIKILVSWLVVCLPVCFLSREKEKTWSCVRWGVSWRRHKNPGGFMGNKVSRNIKKCAILPQPTSVVSNIARQ